MQRADAARASSRRRRRPRPAGTRAAAGRAAGSSPAAPPSPRRSPRSRPAGTAAAGRARPAVPASSSARIISCTTGSRSSPKNMCSVRQRPIPCAPNSRARAASSGLSAFARTFSRRNSSAQPRIVSKSSLICGGTSGTSPMNTRPVPPSIVITSPSLQHVAADRRRAALERQAVAAGDARLAHPARDDRRVRGHAAVDGEDPFGGDHPVDVVRGRLLADEDHRAGLRALDRGVGVEDDRAARGARGRVQPLRRRPRAPPSGRSSGAAAGRAGAGSMRPTASSRVISPSSTIVDRRLQRRGGGALRRRASAAGRACSSSTVNSTSCMSR